MAQTPRVSIRCCGFAVQRAVQKVGNIYDKSITFDMSSEVWAYPAVLSVDIAVHVQ